MKRRNNEQGTAMLLALLFVMFIGIGATATWRHLHVVREQTTRYQRQEIAGQLAEAGIEKAIAVIRVNRDYRGETGTPLGAGQFTVRVLPETVADAYTIEARGDLVNAGIVAQSTGIGARIRLAPDGRVLERTWKPESYPQPGGVIDTGAGNP
ncbi:MAG: hypothetical protein IT368_06360 [Candidatus Hydrogenedentes bacterium]|nr:hypothetical protein [Candidatus Hydrogenedentota bacterium]